MSVFQVPNDDRSSLQLKYIWRFLYDTRQRRDMPTHFMTSQKNSLDPWNKKESQGC